MHTTNNTETKKKHDIMKRLHFFFSLLTLLSTLMAGCTDDNEDGDIALSFGRPIYFLTAYDSLAIEIISTETVSETVEVPFTLSGTAIEGEDFTLPVKNFQLEAGNSIDTVWVYPKDNLTPNREIRLELQDIPGYRIYNNRVAMIPVEVKDVFSCSFLNTSYDLKNEIDVNVELQVAGKSYMYQNSEVRVPMEIDPASTAILGEHYEIVGGVQEFYMAPMTAYATVTLRFLKKEEGKDKVIFRVKEGGLYEIGNNASTTVTISGPTTFADIAGTWSYSAFASEALIRRLAGDEDCANLPTNFPSTDVIQLVEGTSNTLNIDGLTGDLKNYLRNCKVSILEESPWTLYETSNMGSRDVLTVELSNANVAFSPTTINERKVIAGIRLANKGKTLELRIIEYEPTDFLTQAYYDQTHPMWGLPVEEYPMKDLYPIVIQFTKVE